MRKNSKIKQYQFQITITKKAYLNFKNQYYDQKNKILEQNQSYDFIQKEKKTIYNQQEQMKKNTICMSKFDNKLIYSLNQLEALLDKPIKEEASNQDDIILKQYENNKKDNYKNVSR